jgi:hypothetical protein
MSVIKVNQIQTANGVIIANLNSSGANTGFQLAPTMAPAFFATTNGNQSITNSTFTKVTLDLEIFDTNNNFASSTFTPTIAGYYQISGGISNLNGNTPTRTIVSIFKNGSGYAGFGDYTASSAYRTYGSALVYMNGTTDYIELYTYLAGSSLSLQGGISTGVGYNTFLSGALVRSA